MKKTKKILSILLSMLMIISAMPLTAVAAYTNGTRIWIERESTGKTVFETYNFDDLQDGLDATVNKYPNEGYYVFIANCDITKKLIMNGTAIVSANNVYSSSVLTSLIENRGNLRLLSNTALYSARGLTAIDNYGTLTVGECCNIYGQKSGIYNNSTGKLYLNNDTVVGCDTSNSSYSAIVNTGYAEIKNTEVNGPIENRGTMDIVSGQYNGVVHNDISGIMNVRTHVDNLINNGKMIVNADSVGSIANKAGANLDIQRGNIDSLDNKGNTQIHFAKLNNITNNNTLDKLLAPDFWYYNPSNNAKLNLSGVTSYNSTVGVISDCSTLTEPEGTIHYLGADEILPFLFEHEFIGGVLELKDGIVFGPTDEQVENGDIAIIENLTITGNATLNNKAAGLFAAHGEVSIDGLTINNIDDDQLSCMGSAVVFNYGTLNISNANLKGYSAGEEPDYIIRNVAGTVQLKNTVIDGTIYNDNDTFDNWLAPCQKFVDKKGNTVDMSGKTGEYSGYLKAVEDTSAHDWLPANCSTPMTCSKCGETQGEPNESLHQWKDATCTEPKTCILCGLTDGNPLGHDFSKQGELLEEATCTNKAIYAVQCVRCDEVNGTMEVGEPLGHTYVTGALISRATCTEPAVYEAKCVRCGDISGTKTLGNPLGHNYKIIEKVSSNIYKAKCTTCGDVTNNYQAQSSDYINATDLKKGDIIKAGTIVRVDSYYVDFLVDIDNQAQSVKNNEFIAPTCLKCTSKYVSERYASAELSFTPACEYAYANCTTPEKCIYCGATTGDINPDAHSIKLTVKDNVFTYTCSFGCGLSYTVDKTALFASIEAAKNDYIGATYYVSTEALQNAVATAQEVLDSETATQADVDDAIVSIETAINNLELIKYSVTANIIVDGDTAQTETVSVAYGEMFNYFVELEENQAIYKWTATVNGKDVKLNTISQDFSQVINGDVIFNCFIDDSDTKAEDSALVVFYDKSNRVISLDYVAIGSSISCNVEAPKVAFYDFIGWETVSGDLTNVDKSGVSLRAAYAPKDIATNKSTIVALGNVKVNGKQTTTEFYDAKIILTGAESYAYCDENGNILQAINGNVIYAPNNSQTIYVCAGTSNKTSTAITGYIDENSKLTVNAQYYLPSGSTVVEAGIIAINGDKTNTFKSSQQGSSGEYSISLNYGSASGTLNFKSYLTYKDADGIHTIYSESQAISFGQNA